MNIQAIANKIIEGIKPNVIKVVNSGSTGSIYIHTNNPRVKVIRVADHTGHKEKPKTWQYRRDVMSVRRGTNRIYNSLDRLICDFKETLK